MDSRFDTIWHKLLFRPYRLHVTLDSGGAGRPLVLLHGLGARGEIWQPLAARVEPGRWRVVALDLLGFGRSPKPEWSSYDVHQHARSVLATLHRLKIRRGAVLVAHSMGCLVAIHLAATHPKLIRRLVLYEPPLFTEAPGFPTHRWRRRQLFALYKFFAARPKLVLAYSRTFSRAVRYFGVFMDESSWTAFERSLFHTIMRQASYDQLLRLRVPVDIVHGRLDFVVTRAETRRMFADNPRVRWHTVNEAHGVTPGAARFLARLVDGSGEGRGASAKKGPRKHAGP